MKRILSLLLIGALILGGCSKAPDNTAENDAMVVYTTIYPLYDFASHIAGDMADVRLLVPDGGEPHDWEPTPADIAALQSAQILVYNGAGLEHWMDAALASMPSDGPLVVEASSGITLLDGHSQEDHDEDSEGDYGHDHGAFDPHVWLDPGNAIIQCDAILAALVQADPENGAYYQQRYEDYVQDLTQLDQRYRQALQPHKGSTIVVAHEAFGYLCHAYGIGQVGVQGFVPEGEPDPPQMASIITYVRDNHVSVIFFEDGPGMEVAEAIARETGVTIALLDPLETMSAQHRQQGHTYITVMDENLQSLLLALE